MWWYIKITQDHLQPRLFVYQNTYSRELIQKQKEKCSWSSILRKIPNSSYLIYTTLKVLLKLFKISRPELQNTSGLFFTRYDANNQGGSTICELHTKLKKDLTAVVPISLTHNVEAICIKC